MSLSTRRRAPVGLVSLLASLFLGSARAESVDVETCVKAALEHAPAIQSAAAQTAAARAGVGLGRAAYLPSISGHTEYGKATGYDEAVTNGGSTQAVVRLETKLADGGIRKAGIAAATARFGSAAAAERQQRADVAFAVRRFYFTALAARAESELGSTSTRTLQDYVTLLERQQALSAVPENDVLRAKLAVTTEESRWRQAESDLTSASGELESLVGTPVAAESLVDPKPKLEASADPRAGLESAAPIVAARTALEAAEQEARAIRAEVWGNLALNADAGAIGIHPQDTFTRDGGAQFLLGFSVPIFDGGARASRLSAALAEVVAARARLDEARRSVALTLERLQIEKARARAEIAASRAALPLAERNFQLLRARHLGGGSVRLLDVLDALGQVTELRRSITRAELADRQAAAGLIQALGEVGP